jgi:hypothetical protein
LTDEALEIVDICYGSDGNVFRIDPTSIKFRTTSLGLENKGVPLAIMPFVGYEL